MTNNTPKQNDTILTLAALPKRHEAEIVSINCDDNALRTRILDMGLTPHVKVTLIKTAPMGDPLEIKVRGYLLTLRKNEAEKILITNVKKASTPKKQEPIKILPQNTLHSQKGEELYYQAHKQINKKNFHLALVGNQNSGKTTLFNRLTGAHQKVGNFPGVTVSRTDGKIKNHPEITITDLPGIYSLSPYSQDEIIARNFILENKPDAIINIVDAANIERNLFLTTQLIELNIPMVIALNMIDEVTKSGGSIDVNGLEETLGVPVVAISASKNQGIEELLEHIINVAKYQERPARLDFCLNEDGQKGAVHRSIHSIVHLIEDHAKAVDLPLRFAAAKVAEGDEIILNALNLDVNEQKTCAHIIEQMEEETGLENTAALADMRFSFIDALCKNFVSRPSETLGYKLSTKIDRFLTGKYTALLAFLLIMGIIFYLTFGPVGGVLSDLLDGGIDWLTAWVDKGLTAYGLNPVVHSLIIDGVFAGVGSVLSFLPVIVVLFFFLSILEDTGYMARVAFIMDKALRKLGLSGRSFVPMLIGFGCSVPAIMATRTLPSERDRKITILLTPFMSCSAKLPIYAFFTAAFFVQDRVLVILSLYLLGIIVGIITALLIKFFVYKGEPVPFVMELPNYRLPNATNVLHLIYSKAKGFITKAFTIIFVASLIIWFLQSFDTRLNLVQDSSSSILATLGALLTPIFEPLGMHDWRISTSFLTGFMAKESVVSTLTVLLGGDVSLLPTLFTKLTAFVFLVFCLLYTPCVAAIATVKRELGRRYAVGVVLFQCGVAWLVAFIIYRIGLLL